MNVAQMFGPLFGGAMLGVGGFYLPFVVMGFVQILIAIINIPLLPPCIGEPALVSIILQLIDFVGSLLLHQCKIGRTP
jgi:TM2 domain-containing membrane protein YozV